MFMDDEVIGFGVQVRETGSKSFTLDYIFDGRRRPLYIADFPDWPTNAAREYSVGLAAFAAVHESERARSVGSLPCSHTSGVGGEADMPRSLNRRD
jgi:hypothetical protein